MTTVADPETGEVLEIQGDKIAFLIQQAMESVVQEKAWKSRAGWLRSLIGKELDEQGLARIGTEYGSAQWVAGRRTASPVKLPDAIDKFELSREQEALILSCANSLSPEKLDRLRDVLGGEVVDFFIEHGTPYVRLTTQRKLAPARTGLKGRE